MKIIQNKIADILLFKGFEAVTLCPFVFVRTSIEVFPRLLSHEKIHYRQQLELLIIGFYIWYIVEWIIRSFINRKIAYHNLSFEREARNFEQHPAGRKPFGWIKFLKHE